MNSKFWCADPQWAAQKIKALWPERADAVISVAQEIMEGHFTFRDHWEMECCLHTVKFGPEPKDIIWNHIPFGDPEWLYAFNRHTIFLNLSKAFLYTGDEGYLRRLSALWEDWIDRNPLVPEAEGNVWRSLEAGLRCEFWLRTLCLAGDSPLLSDSLREKIDSCLIQHGDYLVRKTSHFQKASNWGVLQDHGLFLLGVWFRRSDWVELALHRLDLELHRQLLADGCHWEHSPMYHCEVLHCAIDTVLIGQQNGIDLPEQFLRNVGRMSHALLGMTTPDGVLLRQGDTDAIDARNEMALGALLFGDRQLRTAAGEVPFPENLWDLGSRACELKNIPPEALPLSLAQDDSGNYLMRTDSTPGSAYLHFFCGPIGGGHGHADLLHIDAGVGSEPVLIDCGRYTYTDTPIRMALKAPASHNTTTVDHTDFTVGVDTWTWNPIARALKGEYRFTPDASFVSGHHLGYLNRGVAVSREVLWLKDWQTAVIFDQFDTAAEATHSYQQYFHFGPGQVTLQDCRVCWRGKQASADLICLGDVRCQLGTAPCSEKYNELLEGPVLTVEKESTGFTAMITLLDLNARKPLTVSSLPVSCMAGEVCDPRVQALKLSRGEETATVILRCDDMAPPRILLFAGDREGCGRAIVFDQKHPDGLCLSR